MRRELQLFAKRIMDVVLAIFSLIIVAPLLLVSAVAIKLGSRGPVFFRLRVAGLGGEGFDQWKLRTMVNGALGRAQARTCKFAATATTAAMSP